MKTLPPELIDGILYLLSAAIGWFARWLKGKGEKDKLKQTVNTLMQTNNQLVNRIKNKIR